MTCSCFVTYTFAFGKSSNSASWLIGLSLGKSVRARLEKLVHRLSSDLSAGRRRILENGAEIRRLTNEIQAAGREIDATVYKLFDLRPEENALLEASLTGQY